MRYVLPTEQQLNGLKKALDIKANRRIQKFLTEKVNPGEIVFAGDSIIENFRVDEYFDQTVINRGLGGYTTEDLLKVFDQIIVPLAPKKLFLHIGSNDLVLLNATIDQTITNILNVLKYAKEKLPNTKIYYFSLTPVLPLTNKKTRALYVANRTNEMIDYINDQLRKQVENFIDINPELKDGLGVLEEWYTDDGIHLNHYGYLEVVRDINKYLRDDL